MSVVIPARDDAEALTHCLRALERQTQPPLEVVVVDNASSDTTAEVARRYGARVVAEPRVGIPRAAATGYDAACGGIIARLDADSLPGTGWVEQVASRLRGPRWEAVTGFGHFYELPRTGRMVATLYLCSYYRLSYAALGHPTLWGSNMALRRSTWREVRGLVHHDAGLHDDLDLAFALGPHRPICVDRSLTVGVSVRSLAGAAQLRRRLRRATRTLATNWAGLPPWRRWSRRLGIERHTRK